MTGFIDGVKDGFCAFGHGIDLTATGIVGCVAVLSDLIRAQPDPETVLLAVSGMLRDTVRDPRSLPGA